MKDILITVSGSHSASAVGQLAFVAACETRRPPARVAWPDALRVFGLLQDSIEALSAAAKT